MILIENDYPNNKTNIFLDKDRVIWVEEILNSCDLVWCTKWKDKYSIYTTRPSFPIGDVSLLYEVYVPEDKQCFMDFAKYMIENIDFLLSTFPTKSEGDEDQEDVQDLDVYNNIWKFLD